MLRQDFQDFVAFKRALGRKYRGEEAVLRQLDRFLAGRRVASVRAINDDVLGSFFSSVRRPSARGFNQLVGIVERFFDWMVRHDRLPRSPIVTRHRRRGIALRPCILDAAAVRRLLDLASSLSDPAGRKPRRGRVYRLIFAVLYALGLRVGELTRLRWADVDFKRRALVIRETKFGKTRLVPFGPRVEAALRAHREAERDGTDTADGAPVFSLRGGRPPNPNTISATFHALASKLEVTVPFGVRRPRLHDLRHSFAVGTLLRWYRAGLNANDMLLHLATFLGHVDAMSTAVYLTMTPELLNEANGRFARLLGPSLREALA